MSEKNERRVLALSIGLLLFASYLFFYRGGFHSVDEVSMFAVTESMVKFGQVNTNQIAWTQWATSQAEAQGFFGQDGNVYSKKGFALSLAQVPLYWLALHLPNLGMLQTVSLLNAGVTALTSILIFMFLRRLAFSLTISLATTLIFGLATIAMVYAKYLFSEPLAGFFLVVTAYMLYTYRQEGGLRHIAIAGLAAGLAVLTRANNLFLLPIFGLYLLWITTRQISPNAPRTHALRITTPQPPTRHGSSVIYHLRFTTHLLPLTIFIFTIALTGLIMLAYNAARSGNPLQTGYDLTLFSPNILLGLYKLLFSPLRGLFVYSPVLLLSLLGWWHLRRSHPAEAWLFVGLIGVTLALFSAWSSGEGLSWGSRFLVPIVPFFAICLAPVVERVAGNGSQGSGVVSPESSLAHLAQATKDTPASPMSQHVLRFTFYVLLILSALIQILGVAINPWSYLAQLQANFGGEFFLENTAALYDVRYSQIAGQLQMWSLENSDLAWLRWGFDGWAFGLSLGFVLFCSWLLWGSLAGEQRSRGAEDSLSPPHSRTPAPLLLYIAPLITLTTAYVLLARYNHTDGQFGPPNDAYTQALNTAVIRAAPGDRIVTVAQSHYHVPMNRFKSGVPITGFAQQSWPMPTTALPLLRQQTNGQNVWLVTIGFPPAAADNATEQWLALNSFKAKDDWFDDGVRLVRYSTIQPTTTRAIGATLGNALHLTEVKLRPSLQPGQGLPVEFVWLPLTQPQADYNLFLQLLDVEGALVAQHDSPPNGGYSPTATWQPGQPVTARHALLLPTDLSSGDYRLIAGLYDPTTGARLFVDEGSDFVELGSITVVDEVGMFVSLRNTTAK